MTCMASDRSVINAGELKRPGRETSPYRRCYSRRIHKEAPHRANDRGHGHQEDPR